MYLLSLFIIYRLLSRQNISKGIFKLLIILEIVIYTTISKEEIFKER